MNIQNLTNPGSEPVDGDLILVTHGNGSTEQYTYYAPPEPTPKTFLHIDYPAESTVGATITLVVDIKFADGSQVPVDAAYSVPIIRSADNQVVDYKKVQFTQGNATLSFVASVPGKYIMDTNQIEPHPTAQVVDYPEIRVYS